jgi:hypothetical protein
MKTFLTVREAADRVGKSPSSIRRIVYPIIRDNEHRDRQHIQPSVEDALKLRMKGEIVAWKISEELLRREIPIEHADNSTATSSYRSSDAHSEGDLLLMLRRELDIKNQQITQQSEIITKQMEMMNGLSERIHESNVLIGSLQQRLALADGRESKATAPVDAKPPAPTRPEKGTAASKKSPKPKRGILSRLFR